MENEERIIRGFAPKDKRNRYVSFLSSAKRRRRLIDLLNHEFALDPRYSFKVPKESQNVAGIHAILTSKGAPKECYVMSNISDIDGKTMNLLEALEHVVGVETGSLISCIVEKLAYYESEDWGERYVLSK